MSTTPIPTLSFECALITGGSAGLGKAMAIKLLSLGKKVIISSSNASKLSATAKEIGATDYYTLDTSSPSTFPSILTTIVSDHPELDCLINNAGIQTPLQVLGPDYAFDLSLADKELDINVRGPMHLSVLLIQKHFQNLPKGAVIMNVTSGLGYVPFSVVNPVYNGTKSWLHFWSMNLRTQLERSGSKVRVVEIVPPMVETELHHMRKDPGDNSVDKGGMSVEAFMEDVMEGWESNADEVAAGMAKTSVKAWRDTFGGLYDKMAK